MALDQFSDQTAGFPLSGDEPDQPATTTSIRNALEHGQNLAIRGGLGFASRPDGWLTLTFLIIPPVQGKDLDNIALTVLHIAHEVLRPHISPHLLSSAYGGDPDPRLDRALAGLKSVNARSVCAYQVIELPRTLQDPPEGALRLALGPHTHWSWWHRTGT